MTFTAEPLHVTKFTSNVELLSQQTTSKLEPTVEVRDFVGEAAQAVTQYGETEFGDLTAGDDTVFDNIDKTSRWLYPTDKKNVLPTTPEDWKRMITDPMSPLVMAQAAAASRLKDMFVLGALGGTAQTGKAGAVAVPLPASQKISATAFDLSLIKDAIQKLEDSDANDGSGIVVVMPAEYARVMQDDPEFTSSDYNTSQAFVGGNMYDDKLQGFLGASWVSLSSKFLLNAGTQAIAGAGIENKVYVYMRSAICLGMWAKGTGRIRSEVSERPDKNYLVQVWSAMTLGATRKEEAKVVEITITTP